MADGDDDYPRTPVRRRALILLLAATMALTIVWMLLYRPGDPKRDALRAAREQAAAQAADAAASAVGRKAEVMLLPSGVSSPTR